MRAFTDITVLLDRSGSMASIKESMEAAFDTFIKEHKAVPSTKVTLVQFNNHNDQDVVYQCVPVGAVEKLNLKPCGNTPLIDAFVKLIDSTGRRLADMSETERPDQVLMVIITDGQENASRQYKRADVSNRVRNQRDAYKWQFVYLGANQDAIAEAATYGIPHWNAITYDTSEQAIGGVVFALASNTMAYTSNTSRGKAVPDFTPEQRKEAEGQA